LTDGQAAKFPAKGKKKGNLCGPLANSRLHHKPDPQRRPNSRLEAAHRRADTAIQRVVDLLAAASICASISAIVRLVFSVAASLSA
jgi:hypothetical protein